MQHISGGSGLQGSQIQGAVSSHTTKNTGEPPHSSRAAASRLKKRERNDSTCDSAKQQRTDKARRGGEERDSTCKPEAGSLVGRDGGISCEASVDRLVCIMQYEWNNNSERQLDLISSRTMLAKVIAATSERHCLVKFLRLGGLAILDKWLQEAHRGRHFVNKEIPVDGEKAVEDLMLALLGALEKLPVDLITLKMCLVGKSVNLLRSHKHPEIQRRSKKLVEEWKKRVESEMESGEGRSLSESLSCSQQQEGGIMGSKMQQSCYSGSPNAILCDDPGIGRAKFASVASLCSTPEGLLKAPSSNSYPFVPEGVNCLPNKGFTFTATTPVSGALLKSHLHTPSPSPPSNEDGRAKSSVNAISNVVCAQGPCSNAKGVKGTGVPGSQHNGSYVNTLPAAAFSGSIITSKDSSVSGSMEQKGLASRSVFTAPCCSSSQQNPQNSPVYEGPSRSSMNSASSCATNGSKRSVIQPSIELVKAGNQPLPNLAASESSMVNLKCPDSPSHTCVLMQRVVPSPANNSILVEMIQNPFIPKAGSRPLDGEYYDRISSTVSSPSETSAHVDIRMGDHKVAISGHSNAPSPHDTTSGSSLPSTAGTKVVNTPGRVFGSAPGVQIASEDMKRGFLQSVVDAEAVGENSAVEKTEVKDLSSVSCEKRSSAKGGLQRGCLPLKHEDDDSLEAARQVAMKIQQEVSKSKMDLSGRRAAGERTCCSNAPIPEIYVDAKLQVPPAKVSPEFQARVPPFTHFTQRPDFDLNEVLGSEEVPFQASAISSNATIMPGINCFGPASTSKPTLPVAPVAPIAVVAASKGPFILPNASYLSKDASGWKGSAATSAFKPMQPRHNLPQKYKMQVFDQGMSIKVSRDFDLNVAADSGALDHGDNVAASSATATLTAGQGALAANIGSLGFSRSCNGVGGAVLDLNVVRGDGGSQGRGDFDLNSGPMLQDIDEVFLAGKQNGVMVLPLIGSNMNSGALNRVPLHPRNSTEPITMPAFATTSSESPYPVGAAPPWLNSGSNDGLLQYNVFMQNMSGTASCPPPLSAMLAAPYGGIPVGFSPVSMQSFPPPFMDNVRGPHIGRSGRFSSPANGEEHILSSHSGAPSCMMGILSDTIQQQDNGGFWSRSSLDLNAGPDGMDSRIVKHDRRHMPA